MRQDREAIQAIRCFLLDMDGTIYLGDQLIEGTHAFLQAAKQSGRKVLFLTNNSSKNGETYLRKLSQMGIDAGPEDVLTSGQAAAQRGLPPPLLRADPGVSRCLHAYTGAPGPI